MTLSLNLPLPVANGAGASVDVSTLGAPLTLTCVGQLAGANIAIEVSNDGGTTWSPLYAWQNVGGERVIPAAVQWMRTNVSGRGTKPWLTFSADLDVAGPGTGMTAVSLPMPVGNGAGAAVDTSALEQLCTFVCTGSFAGCSIAVQISEDNIGWAPLVAFSGTGVVSKVVNASWMRVFVSGRTSAPFSGLMAVGSASVGDQPITKLLVQQDGTDVVSTTTMNFLGGIQAANVGGVATVSAPGMFVWRVGVTWAEIYARMQLVPGPKILMVEWDDATTGVRTLTADAGSGAGTPQDLNDIWFLGVGGNEYTPIISVQDGAKLASKLQGGLNIARLSSKSVNWDFSNLTAPMFDATDPGDFSIFAFENGDVSGATGLGVAVVQGAMHLALWNANVSDILCNVIDMRSDAQLTARCTLSTGFANAGPPGTTLSVISDATSYIDPQLMIDFPGSAHNVATFAKNAGGDLFAITVDGGGNVIATPVI